MIGAIAMLGWSASARAQVVFVDRSDDLPVTLASRDGALGAAWIDHDGDGDLDLFLANGPDASTVLFRNDGAGSWTDITEAAGAGVTTGVSGVLAADLDDDGATDLLLAGDGGIFGWPAPMVYLHNDGDGTFEDQSERSGLVGPLTALSLSAADVDGDGLLDVYVTSTGSFVSGRTYPNHLYQNLGDGRFHEVGTLTGVDSELGACVSTFAHLDPDRWIDLLVGNCNDLQYAATPFELYRNQGDGTFVDQRVESRVWATGWWMGLAVADFDGDASLDFFSTNVGGDVGAPHVLYLNDGRGVFEEVAAQAGVAGWPWGWGTVAEDFDNDGHVDLYYAGSRETPGIDVALASPGLLFAGRGDGTFEAPTTPAELTDRYVVGVASADYDGDGAPDLLAMSADDDRSSPGEEGRPILLRNTGTDHGWITVALRGDTSNSGGIGARVYAHTDRVQIREVIAGSSALTTSSPWPTFGLQDATSAELCVRWPTGASEDFGIHDARQRVVLVEGSGRPVPSCLQPTPSPPTEAGVRPSRSSGCATAPRWTADLSALSRRRAR